MVKLMDHGDLLSVRTANLDTAELETVIYLENRMRHDDERGALAQILHQMIAQGVVPAKDVASRLGAYQSEGISLDEGSEDYLRAEEAEEEVTAEENDEETQVLPPADDE